MLNYANAFTSHCNGLVSQLINQVDLWNNGKKLTVYAQWDTGATNSCISTEVVEQLGLIPFGLQNIRTPSGSATRSRYIIRLSLPNNVNIEDFPVTDSEIGLQGIGILIGMDVITLGDFSVSNHEQKTTFSFRIPSMSKIDYVQLIKGQQTDCEKDILK